MGTCSALGVGGVLQQPASVHGLPQLPPASPDPGERSTSLEQAMALFPLKNALHAAAGGMEQPEGAAAWALRAAFWVGCWAQCPSALPNCQQKQGVRVLHVQGRVLQLVPGRCCLQWQQLAVCSLEASSSGTLV